MFHNYLYMSNNISAHISIPHESHKEIIPMGEEIIKLTRKTILDRLDEENMGEWEPGQNLGHLPINTYK